MNWLFFVSSTDIAGRQHVPTSNTHTFLPTLLKSFTSQFYRHLLFDKAIMPEQKWHKVTIQLFQPVI